MNKRAIKSVLPSLREKKRYIQFEVISKSKISHTDAFKTVNEAIKSFIGELGMAKAGVQILKFENNNGIIRVARDFVNEIKSSLMFIRQINGIPVTVHSARVSGMIGNVK